MDTRKDLTRNVVKSDVKAEIPKGEYRWEAERKRDARLVKGIYQCHEPVGGSVEFSFKAYRGDPVTRYAFQHGKEYTIPLAVAKHLNNNCNYPVYSEILAPDGLRTNEIGKRVQRFNFIQPFDDTFIQ
jgi:hypothetical protein